ncbi:hypothetical protein QOZ80_3BG0256570 [Eleusine coracana subsp. coracana]|nr:hypothetical protein QOZ80_3BG0256570 [Eleusine coracana subsp. coracana]
MDSDAVLSAGEDRPGKRSRTFPCSLSEWVMMDCLLSDYGDADSSSVILAYASTSTRDLIGIGFRPVRPPSTSCLLFDWVPHSANTSSRPRNSGAMAVAAHRSTILLRSAVCHRNWHGRVPFGANTVGILCFGGDKEDRRGFMAAHLTVTPKKASTKRRLNNDDCPVTAALCYICSLDGSLDGGSWHTIKDLPIRGAEGRGDDLLWWETDVVVSIGEYICWVDYLRGMLLCDVRSAKPKLLYVALPVDPYQGREEPELGGRGAVAACRTVCVAKEEEEAFVIRFVDVTDNRCWFYGRPRRGYTSSPYSTISSWRLNSDLRTWKLDSMIEDDEFLTLTKRHNLPSSTQLIFPLVDLNDPQTIYCAVRQEQCIFLLTVNMSTRTLVKTPYTFGSVETTGGEGVRHKGKQPRNLDYTMPFVTCELIRNEVM